MNRIVVGMLALSLVVNAGFAPLFAGTAFAHDDAGSTLQSDVSSTHIDENNVAETGDVNPVSDGTNTTTDGTVTTNDTVDNSSSKEQSISVTGVVEDSSKGQSEEPEDSSKGQTSESSEILSTLGSVLGLSEVKEEEYTDTSVDTSSVGTMLLATGQMTSSNTKTNTTASASSVLTLDATKIVCDKESDLPNWAGGAPDITATTATDYVIAHPTCHLEAGREFQWGYGDKSGTPGVKDIGRAFVGSADGSKGAGTQTGLSYAEWKTFGPTDASGKTTATIANLAGAPKVWVREVLKSNDIPFTYDSNNQTNADSVSAEIYCHVDGLNYDNYDYVANPQLGATYHCVAFNAKKYSPPSVTITIPTTGATVSGTIPVTATAADDVGVVGVQFKLDGVNLGSEDTTASYAVIWNTSTATNGPHTLTAIARDAEGNHATSTPVVVTVSNATPPPAADLTVCPFTPSANSFVIDFGMSKKIVSNGTHEAARVDKDYAIPSGTYEVSLYSYDAYAGRTSVFQPKERWYLRFYKGSTYLTSTAPIDDLADNVAVASKMQYVGDVTLAQSVTSVMAKHYAWSDTTNENGLYPICAELKTKTPPAVNQKPVITVVGTNPVNIVVGSSYVDQGATATDPEDGDRTAFIVATGTVNTAATGTYTIIYNVVDSKGLAADAKTRTITVTQFPSECSDGKDNDGDGKIDFGGANSDSGCDNPGDDNENSPPVITLVGSSTMNITVNAMFTDPGATALDPEDGPLSPAATGTVITSALGAYTITYTAIDSKGLTATPVLRTVNVVPVVTECNDGIDNDGDGDIDYPADLGCSGLNDNSENSKPIITLISDNPLLHRIGAAFTDPGATATDTEDGAITPSATGTVNALVVGTYTITYSAVDSKGLAADDVTRTVKVVASCSDGIDNDGDGLIDYPQDTGCANGDDDSESGKPVITLLGDIVMTLTQGTAFTDPGATANDTEDGNITDDIIATGTVNTSVIGAYTLAYNVTDSDGNAADEKTRTVNIVSGGGGGGGGGGTPPVCGNGSDDDGDGLPDYPRDPGCTSSTDGDERDGGPVLTLLGANPMTVTQGTTFTDPGATASDPEDGDITARIVKTGTVDTNILGTYVITYNASDTQGNAAAPITRTVSVVSGGGGGGGGGGGPITLSIFNEAARKQNETTAIITWNTNLAADSRVLYGPTGVASLGNPENYGYASTSIKDTTLTSNHTVTITGLTPGSIWFFRPISANGGLPVIGKELIIQPGEVMGATLPEVCYYLREYLRLGYANDPSEVIKLQTFLKDEEGFTELKVTGTFDEDTDRAVRVFQDRYTNDILTPWGLPGNTGYVYYTTQKKINEIHCQRMFPLTDLQLEEINAYFDMMRELKTGMSLTSQSGTTIRPSMSISVAPSTDTIPAASSGVYTNDESVSLEPVVGTKDTETQMLEKLNGGNTKTEEKPRTMALRDLLATLPMLSQRGENSATDGGEESRVASATNTDEAGALVAATGNVTGAECAAYLARALNVSSGTLLLIIFFAMLALILLAIYFFLSWKAYRESLQEIDLVKDVVSGKKN